MVSLSFLLSDLVWLSHLTLDCSCLPKPCWHMPINKPGPPSLNGMRRRKDGIGMQVFILQVGRRRLKS